MLFRLEPGEREGVSRVGLRFLLAGAERSSTQLPAQFSTCSVRPARETRSHRAPGAAGQSLLPSISDETPSRGDPHETASHDTDHLRSQIRPGGGIGGERATDTLEYFLEGFPFLPGAGAFVLMNGAGLLRLSFGAGMRKVSNVATNFFKLSQS